MIFPFLLLFFAVAPRVDLVNEMVEIPAAEWRYVEIDLKQQPVAVASDYEVQSRGAQVRVALLTRADLRNKRRGLPHREIGATRFGSIGSLHAPVREPGLYALIVENRSAGPQPAKVRLHVALDFSQVSTLPPHRRWVVIGISFLVFFGIVGWSGRKLLRVIRL